MALFRSEHAGVSEAGGGAFADDRGWIVAEGMQERDDCVVRANVSQTFHGPVPYFLIRVLQLVYQHLKNALFLNATIGKQSQLPKRPHTL